MSVSNGSAGYCWERRLMSRLQHARSRGRSCVGAGLVGRVRSVERARKGQDAGPGRAGASGPNHHRLADSL